MLGVIFYQTNHDLIEKLRSEPESLVVCPSPAVADALRSLAPEMDVITISKWTTDHLKTLGLKRSRKSELIIKFAAIWRHYYPHETTTRFYQAFELFTELRSYTLSLELLSEFFKELDEVIVKSIFIFWAYLDQEKIVDEHLGYKKVTESTQHRPMQFVGFKHISGVQIDMLKQLSETWAVSVFCPTQVFLESLSNDWMKWLHPDEIKSPPKLESHKPINVLQIPEGKTNFVLQKFYESYPHHDLVMAGSNVNIHHFQESYLNKSFFKTNEDVFSMDAESLMTKMRGLLENKTELKIAELEEFLAKEKEVAARGGHYRLFKIIDLALLALAEYKAFQENVDGFALDILEMVVGLNSPRVALLTLSEGHERYFYDSSDVGFHTGLRPTAIVATKNIGSFKTSDNALSEAMTNALKVIGPIKRKGLDFLFQKLEMKNILEQESSLLLIDESLLEEDIAWREILKSFQINEYDLSLNFTMKSMQDFITPKLKKGPFPQHYYSASKIQTYMDCPQKFYFSYIEKVEHEPEERCRMAPQELGSLEHEVIAAYFALPGVFGNAIDEKVHRQLCEEIFTKFLRESRLSLNDSEKSRSLNEIMHYSLNGILFLIDLMSEKKAKSIKFEVPLPTNRWLFKGAIDCLIELESGKHVLLDFKRSEAAAGSKKETLEFKKIQLWVYLLIMWDAGYEFDYFGYLNLSDTDDSKNIFEKDVAFKMLTESLVKAKEVIEDSLSELAARIDFPPKPRNSKVCEFCPVQLTCTRGECA